MARFPHKPLNEWRTNKLKTIDMYINHHHREISGVRVMAGMEYRAMSATGFGAKRVWATQVTGLSLNLPPMQNLVLYSRYARACYVNLNYGGKDSAPKYLFASTFCTVFG